MKRSVAGAVAVALALAACGETAWDLDAVDDEPAATCLDPAAPTYYVRPEGEIGRAHV